MEENLQLYVESDPEGWEKYFNELSTGVRHYQTTYTIEKNDDDEDNEIQTEQQTYILKLRVSSLKKGPYYAWDLSTNQTIIPQDTFDQFTLFHPFERIENKCDITISQDGTFISIGGINAQNKIMDTLFETIVLPEQEFQKITGHIHPNGYIARLITILHNLWD